MAAVAAGTNELGLDAEMFTRGAPGAADVRGGSMVQKHAEKLQQQKQETALKALNTILPHFGVPAKTIALQEAHWDVAKGASILRKFAEEHADEIKHLHKTMYRSQGYVRRFLGLQKRKHIQMEEQQAAKPESRSGDSDSVSDSGSESESSGPSSSGSDSERDRKKKKRKHKQSSKKHKDSKKKRSSKDKKRSKDKDKDDRTKAKSLKQEIQYGKYGIIKETDAAAKDTEFVAWATEAKGIDIETLGRNEQRELFRDFMEEYNTGTLPHRKYYNIDAYEREKVLKRIAKGHKVAEKSKAPALDDEAALRREREEERRQAAEERLKEAFRELKESDKAKEMREQEMLRLKAANAYRVGDIATARKLQDRLLPDDQRKPDEERMR